MDWDYFIVRFTNRYWSGVWTHLMSGENLRDLWTSFLCEPLKEKYQIPLLLRLTIKYISLRFLWDSQLQSLRNSIGHQKNNVQNYKQLKNVPNLCGNYCSDRNVADHKSKGPLHHNNNFEFFKAFQHCVGFTITLCMNCWFHLTYFHIPEILSRKPF